MEADMSWFEFLFTILGTLVILATFAATSALTIRWFFKWAGFRQFWED